MYTSLLLIILNYLVGSLSFAIIFTKFVKGKDIRKVGHKTAGGSNVSKSVGAFWGIVVGLLDILKPIPVLLLAKSLDVSGLNLSLVALAAMIGHCWPIWFGFSGGRGVATFLGSILAISPDIALIPILIFISTVIPSLIKRKTGFEIKFISSPTLTLVSISAYIYLAFQTTQKYDDYFSILAFVFIVFRRLTARMGEYKTAQRPVEMFLSRLFYDK